jgi:hypothetical protein
MTHDKTRAVIARNGACGRIRRTAEQEAEAANLFDFTRSILLAERGAPSLRYVTARNISLAEDYEPLDAAARRERRVPCSCERNQPVRPRDAVADNVSADDDCLHALLAQRGQRLPDCLLVVRPPHVEVADDAKGETWRWLFRLHVDNVQRTTIINPGTYEWR